jgi:hypothetical protein
MSVLSLSPLLVLASCVLDTPVELDAKTWWNAPAIRIPDDRTYVILFFTSRVEEKVVPHLKALERLSRRRNVEVVALSPEPEDKVRSFVEKHKPPFAVGASTTAFRRLRVRRWPQLVILRPADKQDRGPNREEIDLSAGALLDVEKRLGAHDDPVPIEATSINETTPRDLLLRCVLHSPDVGARLCALPFLREKMSPADFLPLCDRLLAEGGPPNLTVPWRAGWLQALAYQRHLAASPPMAEVPEYSPEGRAFRDLLRAGVDAQLLQDIYQVQLRSKPLAGVREDYLTHRTADPKDVLLRERVAGHLQECAATDKAAVRALAMELLPLESEFSVRIMLLHALYQACSPGDDEAIAFLERQLEFDREPYGARPFIQCLLDYLRTGVE